MGFSSKPVLSRLWAVGFMNITDLAVDSFCCLLPSGVIFSNLMKNQLHLLYSLVSEGQSLVFRFRIKVIIILDSRFPANQLVSRYTRSEGSLADHLMSIFIYGAMVLHTGNVKRESGRKKKPSNGLQFLPEGKRKKRKVQR
jgi:hypothetical protein